MGGRSHDLAAELKQVMRLAGHNPEVLEGRLPTLGRFTGSNRRGSSTSRRACT